MFASDMTREAAASGFEVTAASHNDLDVTNADHVKKALDSLRPDFVVHTVGLLVDPCEITPQDGYKVHAWATGCLARHCHLIGATLVHISTCGLFGDERRFYSEYDQVQLKTQYARSKFLGEQAASSHCERTYNIRPGWLFGGTPLHSKNFVFQRYLEAKEKAVVKSTGDKFGSPTYTVDLAKKILELLGTEEYGLYHISNQGGGSRLEYVKSIVEAFGLSTAVEAVESSYFRRAADTPDSEMLENLNTQFLGLAPLESWVQAVERYVSVLKQRF